VVEYRTSSHAKYDIQYHFVWVTKYRYHVLNRAVAIRLRELIRQGCESHGITIIRGNVGKEHVHLLLSCPPTLSPAKIAQYLKGRSSRLIQDEFPLLKKRYWGQHMWARGYFCATVGAMTDEMIKAYIDGQHDNAPDEVFKIAEDAPEFQSES
jgi:Transposase and inactivated derivatives